MPVSTLEELYAYNQWANDLQFEAAERLSDEQLDRPFDMGLRTIRATLRHNYFGERISLERIGVKGYEAFPLADDLSSIDELRRHLTRLSAHRAEWLASLTPPDIDRTVTFARPDGSKVTTRIGDILLHIINHGVHHRAQALNMFRHCGVKVCGQDYLFMRVDRPTVVLDISAKTTLREMGFPTGDTLDAPRPLNTAMLRRFFEYGDWAFDRVLSAAEPLADEPLDRAFEMGLKTLRKTLLHIRDAENWWLTNWTKSAEREFPKLPATTSMAELRSLFDETAKRRNEILSATADGDLQRVVHAYARPDLKLSFRLGESLIQLCVHGTHHRAQAINMLRRLGVETPDVAYILKHREAAGT